MHKAETTSYMELTALLSVNGISSICCRSHKGEASGMRSSGEEQDDRTITDVARSLRRSSVKAGKSAYVRAPVGSVVGDICPPKSIISVQRP